MVRRKLQRADPYVDRCTGSPRPSPGERARGDAAADGVEESGSVLAGGAVLATNPGRKLGVCTNSVHWRV